MIVCPVNVVKAAVLSLSIFALTGCGGGSSSASAIDEGNDNTASNTTSSTTSNESADIFSGSGSASISWTSPTQYTDGTALTSLAGHNVYINAGSGFIQVATINNQSITNYLVQNLISGTYTIAVTAFDSAGMESALSSGVVRTIS